MKPFKERFCWPRDTIPAEATPLLSGAEARAEAWAGSETFTAEGTSPKTGLHSPLVTSGSHNHVEFVRDDGPTIANFEPPTLVQTSSDVSRTEAEAGLRVTMAEFFEATSPQASDRGFHFINHVLDVEDHLPTIATGAE